MDRRSVLMFGSNNYLGLANHPWVIERATRALETYGAGTCMNPPLASTPLHDELGIALAAFLGTETAIVYSSCTAANCAAIPVLARDGAIFSDRLNHASIIDACVLSKRPTHVYAHNDPADLVRALGAVDTAGPKVVVTDGVFSMEGTIADLPAIAAASQRTSATLIIDDSHGFGTLGPGGRGTAEHHGFAHHDFLITGSCSKALGSSGGFLAGPRALVATVEQDARFSIFTMGLAPVSAAAVLGALETIGKTPQIVSALQTNVRRLDAGLQHMGYRTSWHGAGLIALLVGDHERADALHRDLLEHGVFSPAIGYPLVARGQARLRIQPSAAHSTADIDEALEAFRSAGGRHSMLA